ncbi:hypothetical protein, partial [Nostoc sp. UIC 10630]|uniref:hypothetical protein n=1 Tax=Nostoc sp. UIC 10630 TaxID=2100146 RepID=UPI0013F9AFBB
LARFPDGKGLDLWVTGNDGNVYTAYYHDDLGSWKGWYQIAGNVPSGLPAGAPVTALARFPDGKGLDLWVTGNDGNVYTAYYHDDLGSWKGWYQIAGNVPSGLPAGAPVTALARFPDGKGLDLWVTGNDGNVYTAYYHDDLGSWKGWYQIAGNVPSGLPAGAPVTALARFPDGKGLDLWVTGNDGNVYTAYYHDDLGSWNGWYQVVEV